MINRSIFRQFALALSISVLVFGSALIIPVDNTAQARPTSAQDFMIVDCLLPGQVRKLGRVSRYVTPRRPVRTTQDDCEIRGGEYVAFDRANYQTALKVWMDEAAGGDAKAQNYVGEIYDKGLGRSPDYAEARRWYRKAADQGYKPAMLNLGYLHEQGLGVERDMSKALNWYRQASGLADDDLTFASQVTVTAEAEAEIARLQQETTSLREELAATQAELEQRKRKAAAAEDEVEQLREKLEQRRSSVDTADNQALATELAQRQQELDSRSERIAWLESESGDRAEQTRKKLAEANQREEQLAAELQQQEQQAEQLQQQLQASNAQVRERQQALAEARQQLADSQASRSELGDTEDTELEQEIAAREKRIAELNDELVRLESDTLADRLELGEMVRNAQQRESELQQELARASTESEMLAADLEQTQARLDEALAELEAGRKQLAAERAAFNAERSNVQASTSSEADQVAIALLEQQLAAAETELEDQRTAVALLEAELDGDDFGGPATAATTVAVAGPMIEILDPPLTVMRGATAAVVPANKATKNVVGKVRAPAGLVSLVVNGQAQTPSSNGLFTAEVPIDAPNDTAVSVSAVDKSGRRAALQFALSPALESSNQTADLGPTMPARGVELGEYYALVIGNNDYNQLAELSTAVNDANAVAEVLKRDYGFDTFVLNNATGFEILAALNDYRENLGPQDNLLVYYAGHGQIDRESLEGYWQPVDAAPDNQNTWLSNTAITNMLNAIEAKHVMVVADSCYSGAMTRSAIPSIAGASSEKARQKWVAEMSKARSRTALTSGGLQPVRDDAGNGHSNFANAFLDILRNNSQLLEGQRLFREVSLQMALADMESPVTQDPTYAPIKFAGHESGDFFFMPKTAVAMNTRSRG